MRARQCLYDNKRERKYDVEELYVEVFFSFYDNFANGLRRSRAFHETEVFFVSMVLYANDDIRINEFFFQRVVEVSDDPLSGLGNKVGESQYKNVL